MRLLWSLCVAGAILNAQPQAKQAGPARPPLVGPAARMAAQPLFNNNCASCHKNTMSSADLNALK